MLRRRGISTLTSEPVNKDLSRIGEITRSLLRLSPEQLRTLAGVCLRLPDITHFTAERLQRELHIPTADAVGIARVMSRTQDDESLRDIAVIAVASAERESSRERYPERVDVVCTGPVQFAVPVRATFATMVEMVQEARSEIVVVGYVFTAGAAAFVRQVLQARQRGVAVTIIGNRMLQGIPALRQLWGPGPAPVVYSWEGDATDELASLHAKLLICDKDTALVTSANYSLHGLHENVEIGLRVRSPSVVRLSDFVRELIVSSTVVPVSWD